MHPDRTRSGTGERQAAFERGTLSDETPADVLGDVWNALDVLPEAVSSPRLAATTVEMATLAVSRGRPPLQASRAGGPDAGGRRWAIAGVIVAASLAAGFVTGTAGRSSRLHSPAETEVVIRHLDILREAGSVAFLEAFSAGEFFVPPPVAVRGWDGLRRPSADDTSALPDVPQEQPGNELAFPQLEAALEDFRHAFRPGDAKALGLIDVEPPAASDASVTEEQRRTFEAHRMSFHEMPPSQREDYRLLAQALVDPRRTPLVEAARRWHVWVAFADPVERAGLVDLPTNERLEWLARRQRQWRRFYQPPRGGPDGDRGPGDRPGRPTGPRPSGGRVSDGPPWRGPSGSPWPEADSYRRRAGNAGPAAAAVKDEDPLP